METDPGNDLIEVNGNTIYSVMDGLGYLRSLSTDYLLKFGIGTLEEDNFILDTNKWYPYNKWLDAFDAIIQDIGEQLLYKIGLSIPKNAFFPRKVNNIESAIKSINIAYHMNHRQNKKLLYCKESGKMNNIIGQYKCIKIENENRLVCECSTPYPCSFDKGIIEAMSRKFEINSCIIHDDSTCCRKKGSCCCRYVIIW